MCVIHDRTEASTPLAAEPSTARLQRPFSQRCGLLAALPTAAGFESWLNIVGIVNGQGVASGQLTGVLVGVCRELLERIEALEAA